MTTKERYQAVTEWFSTNMPVAETELRYDNPYQLLVAVILSAQCTDKRVNMVTPAIFRDYPTPADMAAASVEEIYEHVKSVSYPNNKSANLKKMAERLTDVYHGEVPDTMEELTTLAGVGRKTANVMMSVAFGKQAMAVDTHVHRVSARIGLTRGAKTPLETEKQLVAGFAGGILATAHHGRILPGRYVCTARNPKCDICGLVKVCKMATGKKLPGR